VVPKVGGSSPLGHPNANPQLTGHFAPDGPGVRVVPLAARSALGPSGGARGCIRMLPDVSVVAPHTCEEAEQELTSMVWERLQLLGVTREEVRGTGRLW
jgi:hypothetical protein